MTRRRFTCTLVCAIALLALDVPSARAWGLQTHQEINRRAAEAMGSACQGFFRRHAAALARRAIEPDTILKDRLGNRERIHHFIDLDLYGAPPFRDLPEDYAAAVARYGRDRVRERGVLPWHIETMSTALRLDLRHGDLEAAERDAAYLGHYVADGTMPLHTTRFHDGRSEAQAGVHRRIELELIDRRFAPYQQALDQAEVRVDPWPARARDRIAAVFRLLRESYAGVGPLLDADVAAARIDPAHGAAYLEAFEASSGELLRRQIVAAARAVAAAWRAACAPP